MSKKSDQYVIYLKQCFLSLYYKKITVCLEVSVEFRNISLLPPFTGKMALADVPVRANKMPIMSMPVDSDQSLAES